MANNGPNKGSLLRPALKRFTSMLIEEARDITGLSFEDLDVALDLSDGEALRYFIGGQKGRGSKADKIQNLENDVAALVGRPAHKVVVEANALLDLADQEKDVAVATPDKGLKLPDAEKIDIQLGYEGDWPTYRRLKSLKHEVLLLAYGWQWKMYWDQRILPSPWTREEQELKTEEDVERFIFNTVEEFKSLRKTYWDATSASAGNE